MRVMVLLLVLVMFGCGQVPADCDREEPVCRDHGQCTYKEGRCVSWNPGECERSTFCKKQGLCTAGIGGCKALQLSDCAQSEGCKAGGRCTPKDGACIADRPTH